MTKRSPACRNEHVDGWASSSIWIRLAQSNQLFQIFGFGLNNIELMFRQVFNLVTRPSAQFNQFIDFGKRKALMFGTFDKQNVGQRLLGILPVVLERFV